MRLRVGPDPIWLDSLYKEIRMQIHMEGRLGEETQKMPICKLRRQA